MTLGLRRLAANDAGGATVEFVLVLPVLLMLLFALLQLGVLGLMSVDFNNAVLGVSRQIRTGQSDGPQSAKAFAGAICARMIDPKDCAGRLQTSVVAFSNFAAANLASGTAPGDLTKGQPFDAGSAGAIMVVTATYRWPLVVPFAETAFPHVSGTDVLMISRIVFKNEPYDG